MRLKPHWFLPAALLCVTGCGGSSGGSVEVPGTQPVTPANEQSPLGINLSGVSHLASELPFVDGFRSASPWGSQTVPHTVLDTEEPLDLDPDGWVRSLSPGQVAGTLMFRRFSGHYPEGDYVCLYDGEGVLEWMLDASLKERTPGRDVVRVTPTDDGVLCRILSTNPANHLRNIRFVMPGFEATYATDPWRPGFLSRWEKFKVVRFMEWQRTNHSPLAKWSERTLPTNYSQNVDTGVALEHIIDLCNRTNSNPWFCIPHLADDDFVRQFADLVLNTLDSSLKVYIEYSNETWNSNFSQEAHVRQMGIDLNLSSNPGDARNLYHAQRITEIAAIFATVFGGTDRLVRVLSVQSVDSGMTREMLAHVVGSNPVSDNIDAVAVAPYLGGALGSPANAAATVNKSVAHILGDLHDEIPTFQANVRAQLSSIGNLPIDLIAYEGGQGLVGFDGAENNDQLTDKLIATNRDPGMAAIYDAYLAAWRTAGGKLFCAFNSTREPNRFGSWGALEYYDSDEQATGKYSSIIKFINDNPIWW